MREIKFRAWDKDNFEMYFTDGTNCDDGEWGKKWVIDANGIHFEEYAFWHDNSGGNDIEREDWVTPNQAIMQYTGLKDKNESEVYDGDILCWEKYEGKEMQTRWVVKWVESKACYYDWTPRNGAMILGNIYENPELLEKKDTEAK